MGRFETEILTQRNNLDVLMNLLAIWVDWVHQRRLPKEIILAMDSSVSLFPEGKLTTTGEIDHFKCGIGLWAQTMQVPVVPTGVDGLYSITDYQHWLPRRVGCVGITFGKPMYVDEADPEQVASWFENTIRYLS